MKYYIIAGEASGDLHGSNLIKELKKLDAGTDVRCWGGDLMQQAGAVLVKHYKEHAFMGFAEVVINLRIIMNNLKFCKEDIKQFLPDVLVLIDYPGFNLRIAEWAKQEGFKIVFYISPQVWAWKEGRVKKMKKNIDKMLVILPFEKDYYKNKWNWNVEYVGHPLVQVIENYKTKHSLESLTFKPQTSISSQNPADNLQPQTSNLKLQTSNIIALLPGSRKQEILMKLPIMLEVSRSFPQYQFIVAKAPGQEDSFYEEMLQPYKNVSSVKETYNLLLHAKAALVTSGTATLETALFGVPEVVCYKGSNISYQIAKRLIRVKYISLVNLIMDKLVVKELIQSDLNVKNLEQELFTILTDEKKITEIKNDYAVLKNLLSKGGNASANAAKSIYILLAKEWIA
ncbi:MAG TPA: lipid-A-disaccharide synthase [Chitinophagaceae bacterium]|nr:lipid-A-disaccharide synthase [Chitinophagaceae bacterium]